MATTLRALRPVRATNGTTPLLAKALIADDERAVLDWAQKEGWRMVEPLPDVYAPYNALVLIGDIQRPYVAVVEREIEAQKYNHVHDMLGRFASSEGEASYWESHAGLVPAPPVSRTSDVSQQLSGEALRKQMAQALVNQALDKLPTEAQGRVSRNIAQNQKMIADGATTQQQWDQIDGAKANYKPGYDEQLHGLVLQELGDQILAGAKAEGKLAIVGGLGGSGKSRLLTEDGASLGINPKDYIVINPDNMKELMVAHDLVPGYDHVPKGDLSAQIHETSADMAGWLATEAMKRGYNVLYDVTLGSPNKAGRILDAALKHGYDPANATSVFVDVPVEQSISRAMQRWRGKDGSYTGRFLDPSVPASQIDETGQYHSLNRRFFEQDRSRFGRSQVVDNSNFKLPIAQRASAPLYFGKRAHG